MKVPFSYQSLLRLYPNKENAIMFYKEQHMTYCPDCNTRLKRSLRKKNPLLLYCPECKKTISIFSDTVFHGTRADLRYWLYIGALFHFCKEIHPGIQITHLLSQKSIKQAIGATSDQTIRRIYTVLRRLFESTDYDDGIFRTLIFKPVADSLSTTTGY